MIKNWFKIGEISLSEVCRNSPDFINIYLKKIWLYSYKMHRNFLNSNYIIINLRSILKSSVKLTQQRNLPPVKTFYIFTKIGAYN